MDLELWMPRWVELVAKWEESGYESFSEDERIWFNIESLTQSINDGGIISYYYNYGAEYLDDIKEDLRKIGASELIPYLDKINELFPDGKPSNDIEEINEVIESWDEEGLDFTEVFEEVDSKFYELEEELEGRIEPIIRRIMGL